MINSFDVVVIGSGAGLNIASQAASQGYKVALFDQGLVGGTCLNVGCIPSKLLVSVADRIQEIKESDKFGIKATIKHINFPEIMQYMRDMVNHDRKQIETSLKLTSNPSFFPEKTYFTHTNKLFSSKGSVSGDKIFIVAGSRIRIPDIKGIDQVNFLDNASVLDLKEKPKSLIIIGGGFIASEYSHFFSALGITTTIVQKGPRLDTHEEPEISELLERELGKRVKIYLNTEAISVSQKGTVYQLQVKDLKSGKVNKLESDQIMIAAGRVSNADSLKPENSGIKLDSNGYIVVNDYLETSQPNIFALGDIIGKKMFRHSANREAGIAWYNATHDNIIAMDYSAIPHAIFTWPQIASVGLTETEARKNHHILIGKSYYSEIAKGLAIREKDGFAKIIIDSHTQKILGFHLIGPEASTIIQEVINAINTSNGLNLLINSIHIHPALTELVQRTISNLQ
jgi:mycothione reductase